MYRLLKDKNNEFQCEIMLEGASAKDAKARLFLEADGCEYMFTGQISGNKCTIPMGKLKKYANLLESGKIRLEIIAEDTVFTPYENQYELEQEKRVTVEVKQFKEETKKPIVEVKVKEETKFDPVIELGNYLKEHANFDGTLNNFRTLIKNKIHRNFFNTVCEGYNLDKAQVIKQILK